ncbi:glycine/D-amino acid oxidase-like deaminating enzyme [Prauserella isguenensis]|uniref:Glycine/D-amino acid oxidase-like deaminating enzyme n=1 Tax=Prauserella isguenensis TaxID=1470180 RepID=A0A839S197_9PSEU|nr:glycine/D-amino acid oxidase-like deaminating enzyme [Prauserella isguenensis]
MTEPTVAVIGAGASGLTAAYRLSRRHRSSDVAELCRGETLPRMWEFYRAYSEAGFRSGYLDVRQFGMHKPTRD